MNETKKQERAIFLTKEQWEEFVRWTEKIQIHDEAFGTALWDSFPLWFPNIWYELQVVERSVRLGDLK